MEVVVIGGPLFRIFGMEGITILAFWCCNLVTSTISGNGESGEISAQSFVAPRSVSEGVVTQNGLLHKTVLSWSMALLVCSVYRGFAF